MIKKSKLLKRKIIKLQTFFYYKVNSSGFLKKLFLGS